MSPDIKLGKRLAEGKTKVVYEGQADNEVILEFKDDITAGDGEKHDVLPDKGYLNCAISVEFFKVLEDAGISTHFLEFIPPNLMRVKKAEMLPVEVVARRIAAGHILQRLPIEAGTKFEPPLVEFFYKDDEKHDPMVTVDHLRILNVATPEQSAIIKDIALRVADALAKFLDKKDIVLADFKIEVGRTSKDELVVGDEINGDSCRLWTKEGILDKDVYRKGGSLDEVRQTYVELYKVIVGKDPEL